MKIQLLYFDGCPNWQVMRATLAELLAESASSAEIELVLVETQEAAEQWRFRGSPTVLIDGEDPFLETDAPIGLSCRIYQTAEGLAGSPSRDQLQRVL